MHWRKQGGHLPDRASVEHGSLTITNVQYDDSGVYVCQGQSGNDVDEKHVTVTVGSKYINYNIWILTEYNWNFLMIFCIHKLQAFNKKIMENAAKGSHHQAIKFAAIILFDV